MHDLVNPMKLKYPRVGNSLFTIFLGVLLSLGSCQRENYTENKVKEILQTIERHFVPDKRTAIFEYEIIYNSGETTITGETNIPGIIIALEDSLENLTENYTLELTLLPEESLERKVAGIVNVSVANLRAFPTHSAELVSQAILGMPFKVFKKKNDWYLVQTTDKYLGWVNGGALVLTSRDKVEDYINSEKIMITGIVTSAYESPDYEADPVSDLVFGAVLRFMGEKDNFYMVAYPDDRIVSTSFKS